MVDLKSALYSSILVPPFTGTTIRAAQIAEKVRKEAEANGDSIVPMDYTSKSVLLSSVDNMLLMVMVLKLSKTPEGLKVIQALGKEFIKGAFDTLHALGQAAAANKVTSWANPYLVSIVLERFGFVRPENMVEFRAGLSVISGAAVVESVLDSIQGIFPFSNPEQSEYPTHVTFSSRTEGDQTVEKIDTKGYSAEEIAHIRKVIREG